MTGKKVESCLSCKLISISCMLGIGGYLLYNGRLQQSTSKYIFYGLGSASTCLGIGEMFNKSPFRETQ